MGVSAPEAHARKLREAARTEMRAARRHRRRAKELMRQMQDVVDAAAHRGIQINLNARQDQGGPSGSHEHQDQASE